MMARRSVCILTPLLILICILLLAGACPAKSLSITGPAGTMDTSLSSLNLNWNYGAAPAFKIGSAFGEESRTLIRFDLSQAMPADAILVSARLRLRCTAGPGTEALTIDAYRLKAGWLEGDKQGAAAGLREPTWKYQLYPTVAWDWQSDRHGEKTGSAGIEAGAAPGWVEIDVSHAVRGWLADPLSNKGLLLSAVQAGKAIARTFASSEAADRSLHPQLLLEYEDALTESTEASGGTARLVTGISDIQPQVGREVRLKARAPGWNGGNLDFLFTAIPFNFVGEAKIIGRQSTAGDTLVEQPWQPARSGLYNIKVEALLGGRPQFTRYMRIGVIKAGKRLHFPYSTSGLAVRSQYATAVMDVARAPYWRARGIIPLLWHPGSNYIRNNRWTDAQLLANWESRWNPANSGDGIMIDELFGGKQAANEATAAVMLEYRHRYPQRLIYPYTIAMPDSPAIREAFDKAADLLMVETYCSAPSNYGIFKGRYAPFEADYAGKAIGMQYLAWISTRSECRRQMRHFRRQAPAMPGLGIYGNTGVNGLIGTLDESLEDYFLGPVLYPRLEAAAVRIDNIGQTDAAAFEVVCYDEAGVELARRVCDKGLAAQASLSYACPPRTALVGIDKKGIWTTVLEAAEDYAALPAGKKQPLTLGGVSESAVQDFSTDPGISVGRDKAGNIESAICPIREAADSITLSFDLNFTTLQSYGRIKIGLANSGHSGQYLFNFYRGDNEAKVTGCRATMEYTDARGQVVKEEVFRPLTAGKLYRLTLHYEKGRYIRGVIEEGDTRVWDSGELAISGLGELRPDRMRFEVRPCAKPASDISIADGALHLKGSIGPTYNLEALVDNIRLEYIANEGEVE